MEREQKGRGPQRGGEWKGIEMERVEETREDNKQGGKGDGNVGLDAHDCQGRLRKRVPMASSCGTKRRCTRSSAVAVIADRTAYDVRYTGKLSNRSRLQVDDPIQQVEFLNAPKLSPLKCD